MKTTVSVELFFYSKEDFDLEKVTEILQIKSTKLYKKGEKWEYGNKRYDFSRWEFETGDIESEDVAKQYKIILDNFGDKVDELLKVQKEFNVKLGICFVINIYDDMKPGLTLGQDFISFAYKTNAFIDFDWYDYDSDDDKADEINGDKIAYFKNF